MFRSESKQLKSITSPQEVLIYTLVYHRVASWDTCFLQPCPRTYHMNADDTQLYVEFRRDQPAHATTATDRILRCTADVKSS